MEREFGTAVNFGSIIAINPIVVLIFVVVTTAMTIGLRNYTVIQIGVALTAMSPLFMTITDVVTTVVFIVFLSIGEGIWVPRLFEFTLSDIAPRGREGAFIAISFAPQHLVASIAGPMSGLLLDKFCPKTGARQSWIMWLIISGTTWISPIALCLLQPWFKEYKVRRLFCLPPPHPAPSCCSCCCGW